MSADRRGGLLCPIKRIGYIITINNNWWKNRKKSMLREQEHASGISGKEPDVPTKKSDDKLSKEKKVRLTNIYRKSIYRIVRYWCICIDVDGVTAGLLKS
jgi:hypothetical protein